MPVPVNCNKLSIKERIKQSNLYLGPETVDYTATSKATYADPRTVEQTKSSKDFVYDKADLRRTHYTLGLEKNDYST